MPNVFGLNAWREYDNVTPQAPIVLLFGDSWFWYPIPGVGNLANRFNDFGRLQSMSMVSIGDVGMEIGDPGKALLYQVATFLQWESQTVDLIAVSGGGNDFAGPDDLDPLMRPGNKTDAKSWFKPDALKDLFQRVRTGYERVIHLRDTFCPDVPILTHSYDYAHASGKALLFVSPWIKPSFDKLGVPPALRPALVKIIIDHLAEVQKKLAKDNDNYKFIDLRGALKAEEWSNEIHPTGEGFNKLAGKFFPEFQKRFTDWVVKPKWMN